MIFNLYFEEPLLIKTNSTHKFVLELEFLQAYNFQTAKKETIAEEYWILTYNLPSMLKNSPESSSLKTGSSVLVYVMSAVLVSSFGTQFALSATMNYLWGLVNVL